jgi:predicted RNA binding protein YcfA (HicA-like mRNA interferase family)
MPKLPVIPGKELIRAIKKAGFVEVRHKGSHVSLQKVTAEKTFKTPYIENLQQVRYLTSYIKQG